MKKFLFALMCTLALVSCKKEEDTTDNNNEDNNNPPTGFTPPTTNYWQINGTNNSSSMDAVSVNISGSSMGVGKPFSDLGFGYCQLRVFFSGTMTSFEPDIRSAIPEGGYKEYPITINSELSGDSIRVELDVLDQNSSTQGNYFYRATGGKVYVSKLNGKLRYTSDGILQMSGVKYPAMQDYIYNCELKFSQEQM